MAISSLIFATNNQHKVAEVALLLGNGIKMLGLSDIDCLEELPETHDTLEANSLEKAMYVKQHYGVDCFAEDTGLEVFALNNAPGVFSARYAGPQRNNEDNIKLLLRNLSSIENKSARFRTVVTLLIGDKLWQFEGIVNGTIAGVPSGNKGFGYDPVFIPSGFNQTFAQMDAVEKAQISHRGEAIKQLIDFLKNF